MNRAQWETLRRARERIATPERWTRNALARDAHGAECLTLEEQGAVAWDVVGAIAEEAGETFTTNFFWVLSDSDCEVVLMAVAKRLPRAFRLDACGDSFLARLWAGWCGKRIDYAGNEAATDILCWQDLESRTHAEVLELLDRTLSETEPKE